MLKENKKPKIIKQNFFLLKFLKGLVGKGECLLHKPEDPLLESPVHTTYVAICTCYPVMKGQETQGDHWCLLTSSLVLGSVTDPGGDEVTHCPLAST